MRAKELLLIVFSAWLLVGGTAVAQTPEAQPGGDPAEPAWDGTYRRIRVPILMYHYVSDLPPDADEYRADLTVSPAVFRAHMDHLFYEGYTPVSLYDLDAALQTGAPLPAKPVILTFDDGYSDHYTHVFPVLRQYGFTATFFIITGTADANAPDHLTWDQIRQMADAGMDMESHTKTHADLRSRDYDFLVYQLLGSLESLEAYTGTSAHMFAYPSGRYDDAALDVLRTLPVWRAVTTERGALHTTDNRLEMTRLRVPKQTSVAGLEQILHES